MPLQTNLNVSPYYDDFSPLNNFYRVMFKAGFPVQARELTQSQSILQDQIEKLANKFLKEGDNIVPGEFSLGVPVPYVRCSSITQGSTAEEYVGYTLKGVTSGVIARVNYSAEATEDDDATFFVTYESSGTSAEYKTFIEGETLESSTPNNYTAVVGVSTISKPIESGPLGFGSLFTVSEGSYFVDGFIVRNDAQTITLDKYSVTPTYKVGFLVTEELITSNQDGSLLDNSQGSSNFAAPGADRLKISLTLNKRTSDTSDPNFIQLAEIFNGNIIGKPDQTIKWDWLYDILAKRTNDESGDYIVTPFPVKPMEYWNDDTVEGVFDADVDTGEYPPVPGSGSEEPLTYEEADAKYALQVSPGLAYVQGYEVGYKHPFFVYGNKARDVNFRPNTITPITEGYNVTVTNCNSTPDFQNIEGDGKSEAFDTLTLYRNFIDGFVGEGQNSQGIPLNVGNKPWETYHIIADGPIGKTTEIQIFPDALDSVPNSNSVVIYAPGREFHRGDKIGANNATILVANKITPRPSGVIRPRYHQPKQYVDNQDGFFGYNSTHKLGIINSVYFTELALVDEDDNPTTGEEWKIGERVFGEESGAKGIVETGTTDDLLVVSNTVGEFVNGEVVSQGNKYSRILKNGEVVGMQFPTTNTAGSADLSTVNKLTVRAIGSELELEVGTDFNIDTSLMEVKLTTVGRQKLLNFPYPEGSALNTRINYEVETSDGALGYAVIPAAKITHTLSKTKSVFSELSDGTIDKYSADISIQNNVDSEVLDIANRSLFSGTQNTNFLTCDNFSGDPTEQLVAGDVVTFVDDEGASNSRVVLFSTRPIGYGKLRSKAIIYFTTTFENKVTGKTVQRVRLRSKGSPNQTLMYQLPQDTVSSLESNPEQTRINYQVYRQFYVKVEGGATNVTLVTNKDNETFINDANKLNIVVARNTADGADAAQLEGRSLTTSGNVVSDNGRKIEMTLSTPLASSSTLKVLIPVFVSDAKSKRKIFRTEIELDPILYNETDPTDVSLSPASQNLISLGIADVHSINTIMSGGVDVTDNYRFDNGQRDNAYELSRITLIPGRPAATAELIVNCNYFEHSDEGDFFSVDSYTNEEGINYVAIPTYQPSSLIPAQSDFTNTTLIRLRDVADFRPVVNTLNDPTYLASVTRGVDEQDAMNFKDTVNGGNGFAPRLPVPGTNFQCDIEYYLPRTDALFLENTGALNLVQGVASERPQPPADIATGIRLYNLEIPAFTASAKNIKIKKFNYKRYRMKDIATIERRIDRIEELVTLSILEQSALNMSVRDAVTGLDRFKNGIVVDGFRDHNKGDVGSSQYRNSVDPLFTHLRAAHFTDQVELEDINQTDNQRSGDGYVMNNGVAILNFSTIDFIQNPLATRSINLQPYTVFTYDGNLTLTPSIDTWQETNRLPDLVIEDNSLFDAMVGLTGEMAEAGIGTVWGDWETTGTNTSTSQRQIRNTADNPNAVQNEMNRLIASGVSIGATGGAQTQFGLGNQNVPLVVTDVTESTSQSRTQTQTVINVSTARVDSTSYGDRVVDVALARTMRSSPVLIQAYRLKPNTRYYAFFEDVNVSEYVSIDRTTDDWPDGMNRYSGVPNENPGGFGLPLLSDDVGTLTGVFIVPNGRPPVEGSVFTSMDQLELQTAGPTRSFSTGTKTLRITSSPTNEQDLSQIEGFAEANFVASGVIMDKQETVVSTRIPDFSNTTTVIGTETRVLESQTTGANYFDPVAQTFLVDENNPEGVFVTELDVFFKTKDETQGVEAYLVTTDGQVPTDVVLPHSTVRKNADTNLRVIVDLANQNTVSIPAGTSVVGQQSGATGTVKSSTTFESADRNVTTNATNTVYNLLLDNYNGEFVPGEVIVPQLTPQLISTFQVVNDEVRVTRVDLTEMGENYTTATLQFSEPELPGGVTATGTVKVGKGMVYEAVITDPGSGYIRVPSVTINGDGEFAEAVVRTVNGREGVDMGVCTSTDATAATTFRFPSPVYLLGNTNYAFVVKAPTSLNYNIYTSKLGENQLGTELRVVEQGGLGSLFMSQNGGLWTEDQTQDVTFRLKRAEFSPVVGAKITLNNAPLGKRRLIKNPIETNIGGVNDDGSIIDENSKVFGNNPTIVKIYHYNHGFTPDDLAVIDGVNEDIGGIPKEEFNTIHNVINADLNSFTIQVTTPANGAVKSGGENVRCNFNRPYEVVNPYSGLVIHGTSNLQVTNRGLKAEAVTGFNSGLKYKLDDPVSLIMMESYYYNGPRHVASTVNELKYNGSLYMQKNKSMQTTIRMNTLSSKVSPILDLDRTNMTVVRNLIDNPQPTDPIYGPESGTITFGNSFNFTGKKLEFTGGVAEVIKANPNTRKISVKGRLNDLTQVITSTFDGNPVEDVTTNSAENFKPETGNDGSAYAKWMSRLFVFENECDGMQVKLSAIFYDTKDIRVYYRPRNIGFDGDIANINWIPFNGNGYPDDVDLITPRSAESVDPYTIQSSDWQSLTWSAQDLAKFDGLAIKVVMTVENPAYAPLIDDFQLVCTE